MINTDVKLKGRQLYEERLAFAHRFILYYPGKDKLHAAWDFHTHFFEHFEGSPRLFFKSTTGTSGKSSAMKLSWFFVKNPILTGYAGAGLVRKVNSEIKQGRPPTVLYDEVQEVFGPKGDDRLRGLLYSYTKGIPATIYEANEQGFIDLELCCPVNMSGLTTKYEIPENFLERCISIDMPKKLNREEKEELEFYERMNEIGDNLRLPIEEWTNNLSHEDFLEIRPMVRDYLKSRGIRSRDRENFQHLAESVYFCGDAAFEEFVKIAENYIDKKPDPKLSRNEQMLRDLHQYVSAKEPTFIFTNELCKFLNCLDDSPWKDYRKGQGITGHHIAPLVKDYGITPDRDSTGDHRGYQIKPCLDPWERIAGLPPPPYLKEIGVVPDDLTV
jgi:putative DNA primase/helicase